VGGLGAEVIRRGIGPRRSKAGVDVYARAKLGRKNTPSSSANSIYIRRLHLKDQLLASGRYLVQLVDERLGSRNHRLAAFHDVLRADGLAVERLIGVVI
jgi:hypothetical protein